MRRPPGRVNLAADVDDQCLPWRPPILPRGWRPSDSPTRSLACRFAGALRSRGSLARSLATAVLYEMPSTAPDLYLANGFGRIWNFTIFGPAPSSTKCGV